MTHSKALGPHAPLNSKKRTHENRTDRASGCASDQRSMTDNGADKVSRTDCTPWRDEETLRHFYHGRGYSLLETGEVLGCAECTVLQWCKRNDVETRDPQEARTIDRPDELTEPETLREMYHGKELTVHEIGEELDCSGLTVSNWLRRHGIETRGRHRRRNRTTVECENCGEAFEVVVSKTDRKYCSRECYYVDMDMPTGEDHWDWKDGSGMRYQGKSWESARKAARERDGYECQVCGVAEGKQALDVHHLKSVREFDDREKANRLDNLITLCRSCHMRYEKFAPLLPEGCA